MNLNLRAFQGPGLGHRIRGMFNLNDPRWGRGGDKPSDGDQPEPPRPDAEPPLPPSGNGRDQGKGPNQGPPDLDELWRDFNRKLGGLFGGARGGGRGGSPSGGGGGGFQPPDMKSAGLGAGLIAGVVLLIWLGTGLLHRAGRPAGRHHPVWQIQLHGGRRFQLAPALPDPASRNGVGDPDPLGRCRARRRSSRRPACANRPC